MVEITYPFSNPERVLWEEEVKGQQPLFKDVFKEVAYFLLLSFHWLLDPQSHLTAENR